MSRLERFLIGLLGVLLIAVLILGVLLWLSPGIGAAPALPVANVPVAPTPSFARNTALAAFDKARQEAGRWQADAQLVQTSATWTQGAAIEDLSKGVATWDFTFFSPAAASLAVITVIEDDARIMTERSAAQTIVTQDVGQWRLDSPEAVARTLQEGGEAFLRSAGVSTMTASLSTAGSEGHIEWFVSLLSKQTGESFTVRLDASNGDILAVESTS